MHTLHIFAVEHEGPDLAHDKVIGFLENYEGHVWDWYDDRGGRFLSCDMFCELGNQLKPREYPNILCYADDPEAFKRTVNTQQNCVVDDVRWALAGLFGKHFKDKTESINPDVAGEFDKCVSAAKKLHENIPFKQKYNTEKETAEAYAIKTNFIENQLLAAGFFGWHYFEQLSKMCCDEYGNHSKFFDLEKYTHSKVETLKRVKAKPKKQYLVGMDLHF